MRTAFKVTSLAITSALALSFSACSDATDPGEGPVAPTTGVGAVKAVANGATQPATADRLVSNDLHSMAMMQDAYVKAHPGKHGIGVAASTAGKPLTISIPNDFPTLPGNVVTVKVSPDGYCISVYNKHATKASSPIKSLVYKSYANGVQAVTGTCNG